MWHQCGQWCSLRHLRGSHARRGPLQTQIECSCWTPMTLDGTWSACSLEQIHLQLCRPFEPDGIGCVVAREVNVCSCCIRGVLDARCPESVNGPDSAFLEPMQLVNDWFTGSFVSPDGAAVVQLGKYVAVVESKSYLVWETLIRHSRAW